jgi:hypothetical protein
MAIADSDDAAASRTTLVWWVAAFVVHRALLLVFAFDGVFFWEEAHRLLVAEALRGGWNIPLTDLQADPHTGGSLVFSALAAVVTTIFGSSLIAVKSVALAWSALGLWLWLLVADRLFGRRVAHALGFVWLAAPPIFVVFNLIALGSHSDTVTLAGLQLLLMYRLLDDDGSAGGLLFAWMAVAGFGLYFGYASALPTAVFVSYALLAGGLPLRLWPVAALGFLVGFSPWIAYTIASGGTLDVVTRTFAGGGQVSRGYFAHLYDLTVRGTPVALYFRDIGIPGDVKLRREFLAYPYLAVYAVSWTAVMIPPLLRLASGATHAARSRLAAWRSSIASSPELPILVLFPVFLVAIAASNQEFNDYGAVPYITFRILAPALPSVFFAVALAVSRGPAALRGAVFALYAATALVGTGPLLFDGNAGLPAREAEARELGAETMGHLLVLKYGTEPETVRQRISALPDELRARAWRGIGFGYTYLYGTRRSENPASELTSALLVEKDYRDAVLEGARLAVGPGLPQVAPLPESTRRDTLRDAIEDAGRAKVSAP